VKTAILNRIPSGTDLSTSWCNRTDESYKYESCMHPHSEPT